MIDLSERQSLFDKLTNKTKQIIEKNKGLIFFVFLLIVTGFLFYAYIMLNHAFATPFSGDYVMQYIPLAFNYYDDWHSFFQTGVFPYWDSNIFLGADTITSDGYYIMFSPFFFLLLIFPRTWIPAMLGMISVLRIVLAGVFFRLYLKKLGCKELFAQIGALAFSCCGWMAYYQWFNNFLDILVFFPCILLGIEYIIQNKRPWILIMSLGLLGIDNFFFFPATCIMMAIYALFRFFQRIKLNTAKDNFMIIGIGALAFLLAVMLSLVVFLPGLVTGLSDPKVSELSYLGKLKESLSSGDIGQFISYILFWEGTSSKSQSWYVYYPVIEMFFPATTCRNLGLIYRPYDTNYAGSLWVATPVMFFFFPAFIQNIKDKKWSVLVGAGIMIFALFTPVFYFLLFGGAQSYSRWLLIYSSTIIAFVMVYLSKYHDKIQTKDLILGYGYFLFGIILSAIFCNILVNEEGLEYFVPFPLVVIIEVVYLTALLIVYALAFKKINIFKYMVYIVMFESMLMGTFVALGQSASDLDSANSGLDKNYQVAAIVKDIQAANPNVFYRTYTKYMGTDWNNPNQNGYNGVGFFNSLYNFNTRRFKWWMGITQGPDSWSGYYPLKWQNLDTFLNIKYYLIDKNDVLLPLETNGYRPNVPLDYDYNETLSNENFLVFENNKDYLNFAYSFDTVSTYPSDASVSSGMGVSSKYRVLHNTENILSRAFLTEEDYALLSDDIKKDLNLNNVLIDQSSRDMKELTNTYYQLRKFEYKNANTDVAKNDPNSTAGLERKAWNKLWWDSTGYGALNNVYKLFDEKERVSTTNNSASYYAGMLTKKNKNNPNQTAEEFFNDESNKFNKDDSGISIMINSTFNYENRINVYLLGKNGKLLTYDNHGDNLVYSANFLHFRELYTSEDVYAVVYRIRNGGAAGSLTTYAESYNDFKERTDLLGEYPIENVHYVNTNKFTFTTNFPKHRFVVTNISYEKGWKVYAGGERIDTYLSTGGFVGFISKKGETSYVMEYSNDIAKFGEIFTIISFFSVLISYAGMIYIENERSYRSFKVYFKRED